MFCQNRTVQGSLKMTCCYPSSNVSACSSLYLESSTCPANTCPSFQSHSYQAHSVQHVNTSQNLLWDGHGKGYGQALSNFRRCQCQCLTTRSQHEPLTSRAQCLQMHSAEGLVLVFWESNPGCSIFCRDWGGWELILGPSCWAAFPALFIFIFYHISFLFNWL